MLSAIPLPAYRAVDSHEVGIIAPAGPGTPTIPASAGVTSIPGTIQAAENWLTESTIWSVAPNWAVLLGGLVIGSALFGGRKGRR
jgi:hypothetical protein